jgi:hypothetical protein
LLHSRSNRSGCLTLLLGNALGSEAANRLDYRSDTGAGVSLARRGHLLLATCETGRVDELDGR